MRGLACCINLQEMFDTSHGITEGIGIVFFAQKVFEECSDSSILSGPFVRLRFDSLIASS